MRLIFVKVGLGVRVSRPVLGPSIDINFLLFFDHDL